MGKIREREPQEDLRAEITRLTEESERHRRGMLRAQEESAQKSRVIAKLTEERAITDRIHRATVDALLVAVAGAAGHLMKTAPMFEGPPGNNGMVD